MPVPKSRRKKIVKEFNEAAQAVELLRQHLYAGDLRVMHTLEEGESVKGLKPGDRIFGKAQMTGKLIVIKYDGNSQPPNAYLKKPKRSKSVNPNYNKGKKTKKRKR